jgi:diguanylate cyclase (GGDEF)-like protein
MPAAPRHPREAQRMLAVQALRMIGTPAEERFDKITRLAKRIFHVPVSLINIVSDGTVWTKSAQGVDATESPRATSYCDHAIWTGRENECLIEDARTDPRTADNPYRAYFVFYAGTPIVHDGEPVGVFCIAGHAPRSFSADDFSALRDLASMASRELAIAVLTEEQHKLAAERNEFEVRALVDPLTRMWNRGAILDIAARELQGGIAVAILMLDLDHFKKVNDTYGHQAGDEVLRQVSARIRASVRPTDAVGRYGGEEFLIVLPSCGREMLVDVAERIRAEVCRGLIQCEPGASIPITVSVGGSVSVDGSHFVEVLIRAADLALYRAKREGRNRVVIDAASPSRSLRKAIVP